MSSIGTNRNVGRLRGVSQPSFRYCAPPSGSCVMSCSSSARTSGHCTVICQLSRLVLRLALSIFSADIGPLMLSLAGPPDGKISFMARAAKSTHASVMTGCTTFDAPSNCAPPGASSPSPVRRRPSSYCSSRFLRASLSLLIRSRSCVDRLLISPSSMSSARLA